MGWRLAGGRRQRVKVEGEYSDWEDVISSVLQGSVFIDDIDEVVEEEEPLETAQEKFADDTKIARIVEDEADARKKQEIINKLARWANKWASGWANELAIESLSKQPIGSQCMPTAT